MRSEPLVGRHAELARVDEVLAARGLLPAGLLLHGREGMGKSALWRETLQHARQHGYRVLECALSRSESRLAYAGLADLVRPVLDEVLPVLARPQARALRAALAISDEDGTAPDEHAVAFGLHGALTAIARSSPIVLAVDDIQWLDPSSALMLSYAIRRLREEPVLLVLAQRDGERPGQPVPLTDGLGIDLERMGVGPLPLGAVHRVIRTRLGTLLTRPQLLRIHAASEGNPLHAIELARALQDGVAAPTTLGTLLAGRVAALPDAARTTLALAAIATEPDLDVLAEAYGPSLRSDLGPAIRANLVEISGGRVRLSHPLIASAAEAGVSGAERRELHRTLAGAVRSEEARAAHLARATADPDAGVAETVEQAARSTRVRGAPAAGAELFEAAARLTPPGATLDRARRLLASAEAWYLAGDHRRPRPVLAALLDELPAGDLRSEAAWRLGVILDEAGDWRDGTALWTSALAGTDDPGLMSSLQCSLAITAFYTESVQDAATWSVAAVASAERSSDPARIAGALAVRALVMAIGGEEGHGIILQRALALEAGIEGPLGEWSPSAVAAEVARHAGDVDGSRQHYATVLARAEATGDANVQQWAAFGLASAEILAGQYQRASDRADIVLDIADQTEQMRIPARSLRAHVDAYLGRFDAARLSVSEATAAATAGSEATHLFGARVVLAVIETCTGDIAAATHAYRDARRIATEIGLAHATAIRAFLNEAELAAAIGDLDGAAAALEAFEGAVDHRPPAWSRAILHRSRAAVLAARGDLPGACDELEHALLAECQPPDRGRALLAQGVMLRRMREHVRARAALGEALGVFAELATPPWVKQAERELARIPGRRPAASDGLTEAEARIAGLVAAGRSNREVASELFLSVKTVEVALTRVYAKVGVRSRTELAAQFRPQPGD